jgi:small subunit ribosomal protein S16
MVVIRLKRFGNHKKPFYRVVVCDKKTPRDGRSLEEVGYYNPISKPAVVELKQDRIRYWLSKGAKPSETVASFLKQKGITL